MPAFWALLFDSLSRNSLDHLLYVGQMCGRITLTRPNFESITIELNMQPMNYRGMPIYKPRYNAASTDILPTLTLENGERHVSPRR